MFDCKCGIIMLHLQVQFIFCMFLCIPLGAVYRAVLHPKNVSAELRLVVSLVWGFLIGWICFGRYADIVPTLVA